VRLLIKLGGTLLDDTESRLRLAREITSAAALQHLVVVVHGGGKQMSRFLTERGIESHFVRGLRVTSRDVLDAVLKVFAGSVNHELVGAFSAVGARAVGLTGMDAFLTEAEQLDPELGFVGRPVRSDPSVLELLTGNGYVPVVACVAGDRSGNFYNVNADQMAVACANSFRADKLLFLTDVEGVLDAGRKICPVLNARQCEDLIENEIATGGMRAKLEAAIAALRHGLPEVVIAPGTTTGVVAKLLAGDRIGTRLHEHSC
jgi:acetylglutamate kinase